MIFQNFFLIWLHVDFLLNCINALVFYKTQSCIQRTGLVSNPVNLEYLLLIYCSAELPQKVLAEALKTEKPKEKITEQTRNSLTSFR